MRLTPGTPRADSLAILINTSGETVVFPGGRSEFVMISALLSPYLHHYHAAINAEHLAGDEGGVF